MFLRRHSWKMAQCHRSPIRSLTMNVEVVRSERRRKTVQARLVGDVLRVAIPATMSPAQERHWVGLMKAKFERRATTRPIDLTGRAHRLAERYHLPTPHSIRWVDNQQTRWGSCTPENGTVRISSRVAGFPGWVLDSVIVHELAHLVEPGHGTAFQALMNRYPRAERAKGFLIAMSPEWNGNNGPGVAS